MSTLSDDFLEIGVVAKNVASLLEKHDCRIVFAESCTAGLVAATLARVPGISRWLSGSLVTYQEEVKQAWINIDPDALGKYTAVSEVVTRQMAINVLKKTKVARLSVSITGHFGPDAPPEMDGVCFVGIAVRDHDEIRLEKCERFNLEKTERVARQLEATHFVLQSIVRYFA